MLAWGKISYSHRRRKIDGAITFANFDGEISKLIPNPKPLKKTASVGYSSQPLEREGGFPTTVDDLQFFLDKIQFYSGHEMDEEVAENMLKMFQKNLSSKEPAVRRAFENMLKKYCTKGSECAYQSFLRSCSDPKIPDGAIYSAAITIEGLQDDRDFSTK